MSKRVSLLVLVLLVSLIGTSAPSPAQEHRNIESEMIVKMESEGWEVVKPGVLRRELGPNKVETFVYGVEGFTWKLQDLRNHLQKLRTLLRIDPTPELRKVIRNHRKEIAKTLQVIQEVRAAEARGLTGIAKGSCTSDLVYAYEADAGPRTDVQGTWASARSSFDAASGCSETGEVYAHATASATVNGATVNQSFTDGPRYGSHVSASAHAQVSGGIACSSLGYASVTTYTPGPTSYYEQVDNGICPVPSVPLQVSVTSTHASSLTLYTGICLQISWSVSTSNGTSPYTTRIYLNNVFKTNGTTYWQWICAPAAGTTATYTLRADVTDSLGNTGSGSHTTTITGQ